MLAVGRPILTKDKVSGPRSCFTPEPLESSLDYMLGNSLRRILLSSIPGATATSIRTDGAVYESRTIKGVKEDIAEIIPNIKQIIPPSENDEPVMIYLRRVGPGAAIASDITPPTGVETHNPELILVILNEKDKLEIELTAGRGRSYISAAQNRDSQTEISWVPIDSIHSPVAKVTCKVEAIRVEQRVDSDHLIIDIETEPAIAPCDALVSADKTLIESFGLMRELNEEVEGIEAGPPTIDATLVAGPALPTEGLNPQSRSYNALRRRGVLTVGEFVAHPKTDLLDTHNFDTKLIEKTKEAPAGLGMTLKDSVMPSFGNFGSGSVQFSDEQSA